MTVFKFPLATNSWDDKELKAMREVINSNRHTMGPKVLEFEIQFAKMFNSRHAIMVNSGSSANLLAAFGLKFLIDQNYFRGPTTETPEFIVPSVSWSTSYYPLHQAGFSLRVVDIDNHTLNLDIAKVEEAITANTVGILAVNLLGNPSELAKLRQICDDQELILFEDNCESLGAVHQNRAAGSWGHVGTFSSFYSHHISTMEGGVVITENKDLSDVMRSMRAHGWSRELDDETILGRKLEDSFEESFRFLVPGFNLRPLEMEAAIGLEQLKKVADIVQARRSNAILYKDMMKAHTPMFMAQVDSGGSSWFSFFVGINPNANVSRAEVMNSFRAEGVETRPVMAGNILRQPVAKFMKFAEVGQMPVADWIHERCFLFGNHAHDLSELFQVVDEILNSYSER